MNGVGWEGIGRIGESLLLNFDAHPLASVDFDSKSRQRDGLNRCLEKFSQPICGKIEDGMPRSIFLQQWAHLSDRLAQPFFYFDFTDFFRLFRDPRAAHGEIAAIAKEMSPSIRVLCMQTHQKCIESSHLIYFPTKGG